MRAGMMFAMTVSLAAAGAARSAADDWLHWRGPYQNGFVMENAPVRTWSLDGENLLWKSDIGGRTTPIVQGGRLYFLAPVGEGNGLQERAVCLDANNGKLLWEHRFNVYHTDIVENRVGWTAMAADGETGNVYAHGTGGDCICFDRDGKVLWNRALTEEFGRFSGFGGRLYTPIVDEDCVILGMLNSGWGDQAKLGHRFVALDKRSGAVRWWASPAEQPMDTTYATPVVAVIAGRRLLIAPAADGWVYAMNARSGETVWKYRLGARPLNTSPAVSGNYVYVTHSEENTDTTTMGRVACIDGSGVGDISSSGRVWQEDGYDAGYCSPAVGKGHLYVIDNSANLFCLDANTGKRLWEHALGRVGKGSPIVSADGVIYVGEQNGVFWALQDEGGGCKVLSRTEFPKHNGALDEFYGSPALVNQRVYFQTRYGTYCIGPRDAVIKKVVMEQRNSESQPSDPAAKMFQVWPAEVTAWAGDKVPFTLAPFAAGAIPVTSGPDAATAQWSLAGLSGAIDASARVFDTSGVKGFAAGMVKVKWLGGAEAAARVRICPRPPFTEDFEACAIDGNPAGWLNTTAKTKVVERDGSKVLRTLSERPSPAFMRLRTYMTPPIDGGYTIEADVLGVPRGQWRPDMGVVNSRYEMLLLGAEPTLRIVSWAPLPRIQKDVSFEWQTDKWYRMKFQVKLEGDKALLRGKVWPRGEEEPAGWTIELADPFPNRTGSPALYAYAAGTTEKKKGSEIYFDNVKVTPNE